MMGFEAEWVQARCAPLMNLSLGLLVLGVGFCGEDLTQEGLTWGEGSWGQGCCIGLLFWVCVELLVSRCSV